MGDVRHKNTSLSKLRCDFVRYINLNPVGDHGAEQSDQRGDARVGDDVRRVEVFDEENSRASAKREQCVCKNTSKRDSVQNKSSVVFVGEVDEPVHVRIITREVVALRVHLLSPKEHSEKRKG